MRTICKVVYTFNLNTGLHTANRDYVKTGLAVCFVEIEHQGLLITIGQFEGFCSELRHHLLDLSQPFWELGYGNSYESKGIRNPFPFEYLLPNHPINNFLPRVSIPLDRIARETSPIEHRLGHKSFVGYDVCNGKTRS